MALTTPEFLDQLVGEGVLTVAQRTALEDDFENWVGGESAVTEAAALAVAAITALNTAVDRAVALGLLRISGTLPNVAARNALQGMLAGDGYLIPNAQGVQEYHVWTGVGGVWLNAGQLRGPTGDAGWTPVFAAVVDGTRRVLQVVDWVGGEGTKPSTTDLFVGAAGFVNTAAAATDVRGGTGATGNTGQQGIQGAAGLNGTNGWSPVLAVVVDGERRVFQVADWTGGSSAKPATGQFVGATGLVATAAAAVDVRGATGAQGPAAAGAISTGYFVPGATFGTPGDLAVDYATSPGTRRGRWVRVLDFVTLEIRLVFRPTFTTADGPLLITGLPFPVDDGLTGAGNFGIVRLPTGVVSIASGITMPADPAVSALIVPSEQAIRIIITAGGGEANAQNVPSGTLKSLALTIGYFAQPQ